MKVHCENCGVEIQNPTPTETECASCEMDALFGPNFDGADWERVSDIYCDDYHAQNRAGELRAEILAISEQE